MRKHTINNKESGIALIMALLAILLVSAVGLGMIYMSTTETSINMNYKDTQSAFFSMRAGLEEMRERMRAQSLNPITLPTTVMPGTGASSVIYITNPSAGEVVTPTTVGSAYFDDEFCHEQFMGSGVAYVAPTTGTCGAGGVPAGGTVATFPSNSPYTATAGSLKYKWVRLTLKQNGTFPTALVDPTQATPAGLASQVCWSSTSAQEVVASALGYANCALAQAAGFYVEPVYLVTSMSITPQGSRRVGQYETAALNITPPPGALALDGPAATFNPRPSSTNYFASGYNSGDPANNVAPNNVYTPFTGPGGQAACASAVPAVVPAVSTGDAAGVTSIDNSLTTNPDRSGNYTGTGGTPSVVNEGAGGGNQLTGQWSSPAALNNLAASIGDGADKTYTCGLNGVGGGPCNGSGPYGTDASPQITFVNGDFNFGSTSGAGVLVVTGTLNITGNSSFDGLILVIGQGILSESGGGNGQFNGSVFLAVTNNAAGVPLAALASPQIQWNGGGTNGIQYNSCWANIGNNLHYMVVGSREEMY